MDFNRTITEDEMDADARAFVRGLREEQADHDDDFEQDLVNDTLNSRIETTFTG